MGFVFMSNPAGNVSPIVPLVMLLWIPVILYLFSLFPAQKAVVIAALAGWMFLPEAALVLPGLPDYTKMSATCYGILLATIIFDAGRFRTFRFSWIDVPILCLCIAPFFASMTNGLGWYDGISASIDQTATWGVPYWLGRIYMNSLDGIKQLAIGIFVGGIIYAPLCLFESRFSPQLHRIVYGDFAFADFGQSIRLGGFRPLVFMRHGLIVGAFMLAATLIGIWLWQSGTLKQMWGISMQWWVIGLIITFVLLRSSGVYAQFALGLFILFMAKYFRTAIPLYLTLITIVVYLYINAATDSYISDQIITSLAPYVPAERLQSLEFRFNMEEFLVARAQQRFWFGWGGWDRSAANMDEFGTRAVQDSLWVLTFGVTGAFGLISLFSSLLMPVALTAMFSYPARLWTHPRVAPVAVMLVVIPMYVIDCLMNATVNAVYLLVIGGLSSLVLKPDGVRQPQRSPSKPRPKLLTSRPLSET